MTTTSGMKLELGPRTLAHVAHDLRSPTSAIMAFLDLAAGEGEVEPDAFDDLLPLARRGISRLLLIADLLTILSDVLESPASVVPVPTDPESFVESAVRSAGRMSVHTLVDVSIQDDIRFFDVDPAVTVPCVAALVGELWRRAGKTVFVRVGKVDGAVEMRIETTSDDHEPSVWENSTVDDETRLHERVAAQVLRAQGSELQLRHEGRRVSAYRMFFAMSDVPRSVST